MYGDTSMELRELALRKLGLLVDVRDAGLTRIIELSARSAGATAAAFLLDTNEKIESFCLAGPAVRSPELDKLIHHVVETGDSASFRNLAHTPDAPIRRIEADGRPIDWLVAIPVRSPDSQIIGVIQFVGTRPQDRPEPDVLNTCTLCARLVEDSLLLRHLSVRDPLTGLHNRRFFEEQMASEWRRAMRMQIPLSFVLVDIDHFKALNDMAGHAAGDEAISQVATVLQESCRRAGDTVCRYGGEEFALLLPTTDAAGAVVACEKLRQALAARKVLHPGRGEPLTVSIGISTAATDAEVNKGSVAHFMGEADRALYAAKQAGRDRIIHVDSLEALTGSAENAQRQEPAPPQH